MNRGLVALLIIMVIVALAASSFLYVIDEREQVVITRFGRPIRTVAEPGLHFKARSMASDRSSPHAMSLATIGS